MKGIILTLGFALSFLQISSKAKHIRNYQINEETTTFKLEQGFDETQKHVIKKRDVTRSHVLIDNRSGQKVELWWIDTEDKAKKQHYYMTLEADRATYVKTHTVHHWKAVDKSTNNRFLINNETIYRPISNTRDTIAILSITRQGRKKTEIGSKYIETLVVVDKTVIVHHGSEENVTRYVLTLLKLASQVFQHKSLTQHGLRITVVLKKIVLLEKEEDEIVISRKHGEKSLSSVCRYMNKITDSGPTKFDFKLFLTRKSFGVGGYADYKTMCGYRSCSIVREHGFTTTFMIAHELGHTLGLDDENVERGGPRSVMSGLVNAHFGNYSWSPYSQSILLQNIRTFSCLDDKPKNNKNFPFLHKYPGVHYSLLKQCQLEYNTENYTAWRRSENPCDQLRCQMVHFPIFFRTIGSPPLDGTKCGTKKWCIAGTCQKRNESITGPGPIHGNWSEWKPWQACSKTCGAGVRKRERECDNPMPLYGGNPCAGIATEVAVCNTGKKCADEMAVRRQMEQQCAEQGSIRDQTRRWGFYDEAKVNLNCTFESDTCSWRNEKRGDQQDWQLNRGKTKSVDTGPSADHTHNTAQGQYIYFESSWPSRKGDKARLSSPELAINRACLSFWYHMFGNHEMGALSVIKTSQGTPRTIWTRNGNQGRKWLFATIEIEDDNIYQISFETEKLKGGYHSDIALDDITFIPGSCDKIDGDTKDDIPNRCLMKCTTIDDKQPIKILLDIPTVDGTRCYHNSSQDICYQGQCRIVGCDGILDSGKTYDSCNVCAGDGKSCYFKESSIKLLAAPDTIMLEKQKK